MTGLSLYASLGHYNFFVTPVMIYLGCLIINQCVSVPN